MTAAVHSSVSDEFRRQPRAVFLIAGTELWERFSYYGLVALLVLFLSAPVEDGGFGMAETRALNIFGLFAGLAFALPVFGGWIVDRYLGERTAVLLGGSGILIGNLLLFHAAGSDPLESAIREVWLLLGLGVVVLGTAVLKPSVAALVGRVYDVHPDRSRETGFTMFMVSIWIGSLMGTLVAGGLGELWGWRWGFFLASCGMAAGLALFALWGPRFLGEAGETRRTQRTPSQSDDSATEVSRPGSLRVLAIMYSFTTIYAIAFYQKAGVLNLFIKGSTDRSAGIAEIPVAIFLGISTAGFILLSPAMDRLFRHLAQRGFVLDVLLKQVAALLCLAAGYAFFAGAAVQSAGSPEGLHHFAWIVIAYLCFALGDVFIWAPQVTTISLLAPPSRTNLYIGGWYVTVGAGNYLASYVGGLFLDLDRLTYFLGLLLLLTLSAGALKMLRRGTLPVMAG